MADSLPPQKDYSTQTSSLSDLPYDPAHVDYADDTPQPPPPPPDPAGDSTKELPKHLSPFERYFNQLEFWKLFSAVLAIFAVGATLHNYKAISRPCMSSVATLLVVAVFSFLLAHDLQEMHPMIADGGMVIRVASLVSSFHIIALAFLHLPLERLVPAIIILVILYSSLVVYHFYPITKEGVHKQERNEELDSLV